MGNSGKTNFGKTNFNGLGPGCVRACERERQKSGGRKRKRPMGPLHVKDGWRRRSLEGGE